jgi:hypothetical protein
MLRHPMPHHPMPRHPMPHHLMLRHLMLRHPKPHHLEHTMDPGSSCPAHGKQTAHWVHRMQAPP